MKKEQNTNGHENNPIKNTFRLKNYILIIQGIIIVILVCIILIQNTPKYEMLAKNMNEEDMSLMASTFDNFEIIYKKENDSILVDENHLKYAKLVIAAMIPNKQPDYTWTNVFASTNNSINDDDRYQQILQARANELEKAFEYMDWIETVSLRLYIPEVSAEIEYDVNVHGRSQVALKISTKEDFVPKKEEIKHIKDYIVNAIKYLDEDDIFIYDEKGNSLEDVE